MQSGLESQKYMSDECHITVPGRLDQLITISEFIAQAAHQARLDERNTFHIQMAVDEACTNVIQHAYQDIEDGEIEISCRYTDDLFTVTIRDHGHPFDPTSIPPPDLNADLEKRREGGLGLYFMRRLMDEVRFSFDTETGNTVTMIKRIAPRPTNEH
jgi:serine/threonine-protein kinase RsbW